MSTSLARLAISSSVRGVSSSFCTLTISGDVVSSVDGASTATASLISASLGTSKVSEKEKTSLIAQHFLRQLEIAKSTYKTDLVALKYKARAVYVSSRFLKIDLRAYLASFFSIRNSTFVIRNT